MIGTYVYGHVTHSHNNQLRCNLVHTYFLMNSTTIITVSIVVNNKHPQAIHLTIPETGRCRKMKLIEVIVTSMYNSDDALYNAIVNSHYITEGQYVAIIACVLYVQGRTGNISNFLVTNLIVVLQ